MKPGGLLSGPLSWASRRHTDAIFAVRTEAQTRVGALYLNTSTFLLKLLGVNSRHDLICT